MPLESEFLKQFSIEAYVYVATCFVKKYGDIFCTVLEWEQREWQRCQNHSLSDVWEKVWQKRTEKATWLRLSSQIYNGKWSNEIFTYHPPIWSSSPTHTTHSICIISFLPFVNSFLRTNRCTRFHVWIHLLIVFTSNGNRAYHTSLRLMRYSGSLSQGISIHKKLLRSQ